MVDIAMAMLLEQAVQDEQKAQQALASANTELENYHKQVDQIEQYRLDYFKKMIDQGQLGLSASSYGHLNRFIVQLDETLAKQKQIAVEFQQNVEKCREHWLACREKKRSLEWLIDKRALEAQIKANKIEQKQQDEFAALAFLRKKSS